VTLEATKRNRCLLCTIISDFTCCTVFLVGLFIIPVFLVAYDRYRPTDLTVAHRSHTPFHDFRITFVCSPGHNLDLLLYHHSARQSASNQTQHSCICRSLLSTRNRRNVNTKPSDLRPQCPKIPQTYPTHNRDHNLKIHVCLAQSSSHDFHLLFAAVRKHRLI
jgi:hypothetical protein